MLGATCGFFSAMVVRHASYFLMYSSHSGTPVFGSLASAFAVSVLAGAAVFAGAVVVVDDVVVVVVVFVVFAGLFAAVFDAAPPQPNEITAKHANAAIAIKLLIVIKLMFLTDIFFSESLRYRSEDKEHLQLIEKFADDSIESPLE